MSATVQSLGWLGKPKRKQPRPDEIENDVWIMKDEAARMLKVSARQVERRAQEGYIAKQYLPRGFNEKSARVVYSRADVEKLARGEFPDRPADFEQKAKIALEQRLAAQPKEIARMVPETERTTQMSGDSFVGLAAHLAKLAALYPSKPEPKPWLDLRAAAEYSGLPVAFLVAGARAGTIRAVNVGTGAREFWRFNREALSK